jgi:hypothetical protein
MKIYGGKPLFGGQRAVFPQTPFPRKPKKGNESIELFSQHKIISYRGNYLQFLSYFFQGEWHGKIRAKKWINSID